MLVFPLVIGSLGLGRLARALLRLLRLLPGAAAGEARRSGQDAPRTQGRSPCPLSNVEGRAATDRAGSEWYLDLARPRRRGWRKRRHSRAAHAGGFNG